MEWVGTIVQRNYCTLICREVLYLVEAFGRLSAGVTPDYHILQLYSFHRLPQVPICTPISARRALTSTGLLIGPPDELQSGLQLLFLTYTLIVRSMRRLLRRSKTMCKMRYNIGSTVDHSIG